MDKCKKRGLEISRYLKVKLLNDGIFVKFINKKWEGMDKT